MTKYGLELENELLELIFSQLKPAILFIANNRKTNQHILRYYLDVSLYLKGVKILPEFRFFLLHHEPI